MTREHRGESERVAPRIVGVIASRADLDGARRMKTPPDLFELRLDALPRLQPRDTEQLPAPLIITARHPAEGAAKILPAQLRRELLTRFVDSAVYVDVELRAARSFTALLDRATPRRIISVHDFDKTPALSVLQRKLRAACERGAHVVKIATRVDHPSDLARLMRFFNEARNVIATAAMGIGRLGRESRIELARRGSALNYGYITRPQAPGQLSIAELRRLLRR